MSVKSDKWIQRMSEVHPKDGSPLITPFYSKSINTDENGKKIPSYGLSSYGYDISLGDKFAIFKNTSSPMAVEYSKNNCVFVDTVPPLEVADNAFIDICNFNSELCHELSGLDYVILPPRGFMLGYSKERICMPPNVIAICTGKSTLARAAAHVVVTPLEPGWEGYITLEISNMTDIPLKFKAGIGITQLVFFESDEQCDTSYKDRAGKYNNQPDSFVYAKA